jgi:hypothetical protein
MGGNWLPFFAWPHPATGMKDDTVKKMSDILLKIWPQGT